MLFTLCLSAKIGRQTFVFLESLIFWEPNSYITYQIVTLQIQRSTLKTCRESFECLEFDYFQRTELKNIRALVFYTCILVFYNLLTQYFFYPYILVFYNPIRSGRVLKSLNGYAHKSNFVKSTPFFGEAIFIRWKTPHPLLSVLQQSFEDLWSFEDFCLKIHHCLHLQFIFRSRRIFQDFKPKMAKIFWENLTIFWTKLSDKV